MTMITKVNSKDLRVLVTVGNRKSRSTQQTTLREPRKWSCIKCGSCCAIIGCKHLNKHRLCDIYETRPEICRVKDDQTKYCKHCRHIERRNRYKIEAMKKRDITELEAILSKGFIEKEDT